ncbi:MAG: gamma-glutamyl-gamma-aminobutyrate hydrolase family protein [Bacteroidetes bacterium]|nr:MAG: gamma-glutamyl-gamma-aminobutyrate hydrolase family protein [Bacteroidota bacterium]
MKIIYTIIFFLGVLLNSCGSPKSNKNSEPVKETIIAISKAHGSSGYVQYKKWLINLDSNLVLYDLYELPIDSALKIMQTVDALLITGGPDVNPNLYSYDSMAYICETPDNYRDSLETLSIKYAFDHKLPILGICRGQQILNITFGGTLITDIPSQHPSSIIHRVSKDKCYHSIYIKDDSYLHSIFDEDSTIVNSAHHQAVEKLGNHLIVFAHSKDSIIESIGFENNYYSNFFLGVQFHPEHMIGTDISKNIGMAFIKSAKKTNN